VKRVFDLVVAALALVMVSPVIGAAAIAVKLDSGGPALYQGPRVGRGGRIFQIYKLRTMQVGSEGSGPAVTSSGDDRVTPVGRFLRRTKADELPQLLNVLKGDMSLVGPRPEHPNFVQHYPPDQRESLTVRPGMTGPTTLAFIDEEKILQGGGDPEATYVERIMPRKLALDREYVRNASFAGDLWILLETGGVIVLQLFIPKRQVRRPKTP
jgi:lipopolysaccharide/colanic/teichoic acid biosynthesis glycosyltransferase